MMGRCWYGVKEKCADSSRFCIKNGHGIFEHIARGRSREMYKTCVDYCVHKMQSERHGRLKVDMRIALDGSL